MKKAMLSAVVTATVAVDRVRVSWKRQAAKKASDYLDMTPFSRSGLVEQLIFEGFSRGQANYGAGVAL